MADPQNRLRVAQEFINFGTKASNAGLSYLQAQRHQEQIDEVDRVARDKVLKERLHQADMYGRILAADDPKMSVEAQIIALQEKVGLQIDDPHYKELVRQLNEGFDLKRGEVTLSKYNGEVKRNAVPTAKSLYQQYLSAQKGVRTPNGQVEEEPFTGSFIEYTAQQIEDVRIAAITEMSGRNKFFTTVLSAKGKYLDYGPIKTEVAKIQGELDHKKIFNDGLKSATEDIKHIMINGNTISSAGPVGSTGIHTSGQSLKFITDELKYRGLDPDEVNRIVFISIMSGLEVQIENEGTDLIGTDYFDNIIDLLHYRDSDPKNGISQFEKDPEGSRKIITKIREYEKNLNTEFEAGTKKRSETEEERLEMEAIGELSRLVRLASVKDEDGNTPTKSYIADLIAQTFQSRLKGENLYGLKYTDNAVVSNFRERLETLYEQADDDDKKILDDNDKQFRGEIETSITDTLSVINSEELMAIDTNSKPSEFDTQYARLNEAETKLNKLKTEAINRLTYKWDGSREFFNKIRTGLQDIGKARRELSEREKNAVDTTSQRGLAVVLENAVINYDEKVVGILQRDEPKLSALIRNMKLLSPTDPKDITLYTDYHNQIEDILNQVMTKPSYNQINQGIINTQTFVFNDASRKSYRNSVRAIEVARAKAASEVKIIINPEISRDFRVGIERRLNTLQYSSEASTFDGQIKQIQGLMTETVDAFQENKISETTFNTMQRDLNSALTNLNGLVNKNYGSIKIFGDSKDRLARRLTGYSREGMKINIINNSAKVVFGVFEQEHEALQRHLIDISNTFTTKKIIPAVGTKKELKVTQEGMFMSGVSYHNKRIRELAFTKHRNKMTGVEDTDSILKYAADMKQSGEWSDEEIQIIEEVATFESIPGVTSYLARGFKNITTAGDNKFVQGYATRNLGIQPITETTPNDASSSGSPSPLIKEVFKIEPINKINTNLENTDNTPDMKTSEEVNSAIDLKVEKEPGVLDLNLLAPVETDIIE